MTGTVAEARGIEAGHLRRWLRDDGVCLAVAVLVVYNLLFTASFATVSNLDTQLVQVAPVVIVTLGTAMVIGTEGVDLSGGLGDGGTVPTARLTAGDPSSTGKVSRRGADVLGADADADQVGRDALQDRDTVEHAQRERCATA